MHALDALSREMREAIGSASTQGELRDIELRYLGRKQGKLTAILRGLKDLPAEERAIMGTKANGLREELERLLAEKQSELKGAHTRAQLEKEAIDISLPGRRNGRGHIHPLTRIRREAEGVFIPMGFEIVDGPHVESEFYNFDSLNIPADHPARDFWDTFWIRQQPRPKDPKQRLLLRTHTSALQVRYMQSHQPPFRMIAPGPVYRYEASDASHDSEFINMEGLIVDKDISVSHLKYILLTFFRTLLSDDVEIRLRPSFFPFVEPGFEIDVSCTTCRGKGCAVCKQSGWLELAGAGMVHDEVFRAAGYVPGEWRGAAFGVGMDRIAMMKYKIPDIRLFRQNHMKFLEQF